MQRIRYSVSSAAIGAVIAGVALVVSLPFAGLAQTDPKQLAKKPTPPVTTPKPIVRQATQPPKSNTGNQTVRREVVKPNKGASSSGGSQQKSTTSSSTTGSKSLGKSQGDPPKTAVKNTETVNKPKDAIKTAVPKKTTGEVVKPADPKKVDLVKPADPKKVDLVKPADPKKVDLGKPADPKKVDLGKPADPKKVDLGKPADPKKVDLGKPADPKKVDLGKPADPKKVDLGKPADPKKVDLGKPADPKKVDLGKPADPKKVDLGKPADPKKVDLGKPADPKKVGGAGVVDPTKLPLKSGTAGPLGPTAPGSKTATPAIKGPVIQQTLIHKPAVGVNIKPLVPSKLTGNPPTWFKPVKPFVPAPKLVGPAWYQPAPKFSWYPWGGKKYFPYFFVGTVVTGTVVVAGANYWRPPPPSCYAGGSTVYYYPGTRVCYDFSVAREDDDFECHGKVFKYRPSRYRTVETMIEQESSAAVPVTTWLEKEPTRKVQVQAAIDRAAARAQTIASVPPEKLDCSACLAALGPTEGQDGQATVSVVNNCDHDISVSGGLTKTGAPADTPAVCEFQGDVPAGQEVVACTKPTSDFAEAQVFLNAVVPVEGTAKPAPACRIPDQPKAN